MDVNKNLRNMLNACFERCKAHDTFREAIHDIARAAMFSPRDRRVALVEIMKLCDPKFTAPVEWPEDKIPVEPRVQGQQPERAPEPEVRPEGIIHGGEEITSKKGEA
jgi:hypothetical protein